MDFHRALSRFAVKIPMFPLHTWLPTAHTEAPTAGSVLLASLLLKMGTSSLFALTGIPETAMFIVAPPGDYMLLLKAYRQFKNPEGHRSCFHRRPGVRVATSSSRTSSSTTTCRGTRCGSSSGSGA